VTAQVSQVPPQPIPDPDSLGFWLATAKGNVELCRCQECRLWMQPPLERCRRCGGRTSFEPVSGRGVIYSLTTIHYASVPGFADRLPYVAIVVEMEEQTGLRLCSHLVDGHQVPNIGNAVSAEVVTHPGGTFNVVAFRLEDHGEPIPTAPDGEV
jgi:uncharacterized OB-fold protein